MSTQRHTASSNSACFLAYRAAQVNRSDVHHVHPKNYLKSQGRGRVEYNEVADFLLAQSETSIAMGDKPPEKYFAELVARCDVDKKKHAGIRCPPELKANPRVHYLPLSLLDGAVLGCDVFLAERRTLVAKKIGDWFEVLG
jgi:hypothetical protein